MKAKTADIGVIVGRFQVAELTTAHKDLIQGVIDKHDKVIIFLGQSITKVTLNNTLDFESRQAMILQEFPDVGTVYIRNSKSDKDWSNELDLNISLLVGPNQTVTLYGSRDSFLKSYTGRYPTQELIQTSFISGTEHRKECRNKVRKSSDWRAGAIWAVNNQYIRPMMTVDNAIFDGIRQYILLGRKKDEKKYRFIGGFLGNNELVEDAVRRETKEETDLEVIGLTYVESLIVDDWRYRSEVEKITTLFFYSAIKEGHPRPGDDMYELRWFKCAELTEDEFEDTHKPLFRSLSNHLNIFNGKKL